MNRARFSLAATFVTLALGAVGLAAQAAQAPPMKSVLAGKKLTPPARGEVIVEYIGPNLKAVKDMIVTTFQVKNIGVAPIARLTITQSWYDKAGSVVGGGKGYVDGLLQPGDVQTVTVESPKKESYARDQYNFTHANGSVKAKKVPKLAKTPAAAPSGDAAPAKK